uniref:Uncharacterized protein n=1 Tax=Clytia hemisphaerica TaxID=252671 RepID=A0A7M5X6Z5_9CNID
MEEMNRTIASLREVIDEKDEIIRTVRAKLEESEKRRRRKKEIIQLLKTENMRLSKKMDKIKKISEAHHLSQLQSNEHENNDVIKGKSNHNGSHSIDQLWKENEELKKVIASQEKKMEFLEVRNKFFENYYRSKDKDIEQQKSSKIEK